MIIANKTFKDLQELMDYIHEEISPENILDNPEKSMEDIVEHSIVKFLVTERLSSPGSSLIS